MNFKVIISLGVLSILTSCGYLKQIEYKSASINRYENVALSLAKKNRLLKVQITQLKYEVSELKSTKAYLKLKIEKLSGKKRSRNIASIPILSVKHDLVKDGIYNWSSGDLLKVARLEFDKKNYEKAAQYYFSFFKKFKNDQRIDDQFLFEAGITSFESKKHYNWSLAFFDRLIYEYPNSNYFRGAKLWRGLTYLKMGNNKKFFSTVEEFRKKYRNTKEWHILSRNYEKMVHLYK